MPKRGTSLKREFTYLTLLMFPLFLANSLTLWLWQGHTHEGVWPAVTTGLAQASGVWMGCIIYLVVKYAKTQG